MCALLRETCMDRNAPDGLRDSAKSAYDDSKALIERWQSGTRTMQSRPGFPHIHARTVRGPWALWAERPECLMQTHLSEQTDEIAWALSYSPTRAIIWIHMKPSACWGNGGCMGMRST